MNKSVFYKSRLFVLICYLFLNVSCSSDDNSPSFDVSLIYGQWYDVDLCNTQNSLEINQDKTYIRIRSGNTCTNNEYDTYKYTGNYSINGDNINFDQQTEELIEEGNTTTVILNVDTTILHTKVIELTETSLIIEFKIRDNLLDEESFYYWNLEK